MRFSAVLRTAVSISAVLIASFCLCAQAQDTQAKEALGMPARASAAEYQSHAEVGAVSIGADFMRHSVPTPQATYTSEEYVVVEVGFYGPQDAKLALATDAFSLRVNGKKAPVRSEHYELAFKSLKDPEWEPPASAEGKSKTSFGTGGKGNQDGAPAPVHMPIELRRTMEGRVQKAALPEGDRVLPQAGLIFFTYRGKAEGIKSLELIYEGAAGKVSIPLQP